MPLSLGLTVYKCGQKSSALVLISDDMPNCDYVSGLQLQGTRMWRRGADPDGYVANFVETEQIVRMNGYTSSFVQVILLHVFRPYKFFIHIVWFFVIYSLG